MALLHTCPSCNKSYAGVVCEDCFSSGMSKYSSNIKDQTAFIKKYLKEKNYDYMDNINKNYASMPDPIISGSLPDPRGGSYYMDNDDIIDVSKIPVEKPTLKVFHIVVWEHRGPGRIQRDIIVMLSRNLANAFKLCGYHGSEFELVGEELKGPFKEGSILSSWKDND